MTSTQTLICTVGTSLFANLEYLQNAVADGSAAPQHLALAEPYSRKDWAAIAEELLRLDENERIVGAEINSIASLAAKNYATENCGLYFLHSATESGQAIGEILRRFYDCKGNVPVTTVAIADLDDANPKRFRTRGLRNLAGELCRLICEHGAAHCAINATGGYKAQIAISVLMGQALSIPVYYKHERFSEIISFPPLPVSLDFDVWITASGMLQDLARSKEAVPFSQYEPDWHEKFEALVERVTIDGTEYLELSATGVIFWETFRNRLQTDNKGLLPATVPPEAKAEPRLENAGWPGQHPEVAVFMKRVTNEVPQVVQCTTHYFNPDLPERTRFRLASRGIEGILSNGTYTVKFRVETSAETDLHRKATVGLLNDWLARRQD